MPRQRLVAIGRIGRPHGVRGEVRMDCGPSLPRGLEGYTEFFLGAAGSGGEAAGLRSVGIEGHRVHGRFLVVKFAGFDSPEDARALLHEELYVKRSEMPPLPDDEYYYVDLLGCRVLGEEDEELGLVVDVFATGAHDVVVVETGGREWMIPMVSQHVGTLDLEAGVVRVREVEGLRR
jgi:16S rRNA processing protein RimM